MPETENPDGTLKAGFDHRTGNRALVDSG